MLTEICDQSYDKLLDWLFLRLYWDLRKPKISQNRHGRNYSLMWLVHIAQNKATITACNLSPWFFCINAKFINANLKAIRYESTSLNRIVADISHRVIVALDFWWEIASLRSRNAAFSCSPQRMSRLIASLATAHAVLHEFVANFWPHVPLVLLGAY